MSSKPPQLKSGRGPQKTTREDWIKAALETLVSEGVDQVKVANLSDKLDCARASFYWYFTNREELLDALLDYWQGLNTRAIVDQANTPAPTINASLVNVFRLWSDETLFDTRLDFAVRAWARQNTSIHRAVDISDDARIGALEGMFRRFDFPAGEARIRARIVYYTQIGYNALEIRDTPLQRALTAADYLFCHTGVRPSRDEIAELVCVTGYTLDAIEALDGVALPEK